MQRWSNSGLMRSASPGLFFQSYLSRLRVGLLRSSMSQLSTLERLFHSADWRLRLPDGRLANESATTVPLDYEPQRSVSAASLRRSVLRLGSGGGLFGIVIHDVSAEGISFYSPIQLEEQTTAMVFTTDIEFTIVIVRSTYLSLDCYGIGAELSIGS